MHKVLQISWLFCIFRYSPENKPPPGLVHVMVLVVVIPFIFLDDRLELGVAVWIVCALQVFLIQNVIGHVLAHHVPCIVLNSLLHEGIPVGVPAAMPVAFQHDCLKLRIVQGKEVHHAPAGCFRTVPVVPQRCAAEFQLALHLP